MHADYHDLIGVLNEGVQYLPGWLKQWAAAVLLSWTPHFPDEYIPLIIDALTGARVELILSTLSTLGVAAARPFFDIKEFKDAVVACLGHDDARVRSIAAASLPDVHASFPHALPTVPPHVLGSHFSIPEEDAASYSLGFLQSVAGRDGDDAWSAYENAANEAARLLLHGVFKTNAERRLGSSPSTTTGWAGAMTFCDRYLAFTDQQPSPTYGRLSRIGCTLFFPKCRCLNSR